MAEDVIVLDTHVWFWAVTGDKRLKSAEVESIRRALKRGKVLVPAISVWELAMLAKRNRLQLTQPVHEWIADALEKSGFILAPLSADVAIDSVSLPGTFHDDPADRMIVATARCNQATLLTHDTTIIRYAQGRHVNVFQR